MRVVETSETGGSADAIRHAKQFITSDFIVLGCDLLTDVSPHLLVNTHTLQNASMTALFYHVPKTPPDERMRDAHQDAGVFVGLDDHSSRLLFVKQKDDLDDELVVRKSLITRFRI